MKTENLFAVGNPFFEASNPDDASMYQLALDILEIDYEPVEHNQNATRFYVAKGNYNKEIFDQEVESIIHRVNLDEKKIIAQLELNRKTYSKS